jgi:hypothetical protein
LARAWRLFSSAKLGVSASSGVAPVATIGASETLIAWPSFSDAAVSRRVLQVRQPTTAAISSTTARAPKTRLRRWPST